MSAQWGAALALGCVVVGLGIETERVTQGVPNDRLAKIGVTVDFIAVAVPNRSVNIQSARLPLVQLDDFLVSKFPITSSGNEKLLARDKNAIADLSQRRDFVTGVRVRGVISGFCLGDHVHVVGGGITPVDQPKLRFEFEPTR